MKKLLIINKFQFGYHIDVYKWCRYLKDEYQIKVVTFDEGKPRVEMEGVSVCYISAKGSRLRRGLLYLVHTLMTILFFKGKIIVCSFPGCHLYKRILPWKHMHLDVRTMTISTEPVFKAKADEKLKLAASLFDSVSAISEGVARELSSERKIAILPLGADVESWKPKDYSHINLLYIGTFNNRHIDVTIRALKSALDVLGSEARLHYDIIGDGKKGELDAYQKLVRELGLVSYVDLHGYVQHDKLKTYLEKCNVGVSYIPILPYYDCQPPTKTFEYALSGLYVIATGTQANKEVINSENGIIINDSLDDVTHAIISVYKNRECICEQRVRASLRDYEWSNIVKTKLCPILDSLN